MTKPILLFVKIQVWPSNDKSARLSQKMKIFTNIPYPSNFQHIKIKIICKLKSSSRFDSQIAKNLLQQQSLDMSRTMQTNQSTLESSKKKFSHSTSKILYVSTFFINKEIHYVLQCESKEVFVGHFDSTFKTIWQGVFKQDITCIAYCHKNQVLFAGSVKGSILVMNLSANSEPQNQKIDPINGQTILSMFAYCNETDHTTQLIALNNQGILRKYKNNKYQCSIKLPFTIVKSLSNKTIKSKIDIAMVFFKKQGKFPYVFSAQFYIDLMNQNDQIANALIEQYEKSLNYEADEQILTENISLAAISNSKSILITANDKRISIFGIIKQGKWFLVVPDFKFQHEAKILNIDIVDTSLLYITQKGISTFDVQRRAKVANGLTFGGSQYQIAYWCELPYQIVYGTSQAAKLKFISCQLKQLKSE